MSLVKGGNEIDGELQCASICGVGDAAGEAACGKKDSGE